MGSHGIERNIRWLRSPKDALAVIDRAYIAELVTLHARLRTLRREPRNEHRLVSTDILMKLLHPPVTLHNGQEVSRLPDLMRQRVFTALVDDIGYTLLLLARADVFREKRREALIQALGLFMKDDVYALQTPARKMVWKALAQVLDPKAADVRPSKHAEPDYPLLRMDKHFHVSDDAAPPQR